MKTFRLFLTSIFTICCSVIYADTFEVDGLRYSTQTSDEVAVVKYSTVKPSGDIVIPETVEYNNNKYSVTSIGYSAFNDCTALTNIIIPKSVVEIAQYAFSGCTGLTNIVFPTSIKFISDYAFEGSVNITEITCNSFCAPRLGKEVFDSQIANKAVLKTPTGSCYLSWQKYFSNFDRQIIGNATWFFDNEGNAYVQNTTGLSAFTNEILSSYSGYRLLKKIHIDGFSSIAERCFAETSIEEVYIVSNKYVRIEKEAFYNCQKLNTIQLEYVSLVESFAFYNCRSLEYVDLSGGVKLKSGAFASTGIEVVVHPYSGLEEWGGAFSCYKKNRQVLHVIRDPYATNFEGVFDDLFVVPEKTDGTDYESTLFPLNLFVGYYYNNLVEWNDKIFVFGQVFKQTREYNAAYESTVDTILYVPGIFSASDDLYCLLKETYKTGKVLKGTAPFGCDQLYSIEKSNAIYWNDNELLVGNANSVIIEGTKSIAENAFSRCFDLKSVEIPSSVEMIHPNTFSGCLNLSNINVSKGNKVYDSREGCNAIIKTAENKLILATKSTFIPEGITSIGANAFSACPDTDVRIPASVISIEENAFSGTNCLYFESKIPAKITGDIFGKNVVFVPKEAYDAYCDADVWKDYKERIVTREMAERTVIVTAKEGMSGVLNAIGIDDIEKVVKLKVIGSINSYDIIIFRDKMPLLSDLDLSEAKVISSIKPHYQKFSTSKNSFGGYAFYECDNLVTIKLPQDLECLGDYAFYGCDNLISVDASKTETLNISPYAFAECPKMRDFIAPQVVNEIEDAAFRKCKDLHKLDFTYIVGSVRSAFGESGLAYLDVDSVGGNISEGAFWFAYHLKEVKIGTIMGNIENKAFGYCPCLTDVIIKRGPHRVGSKIFYDSENVRNISIGEGCFEIADNAFGSFDIIFGVSGQKERPSVRKKLSTVVLPNSIQKIGNEAFYWCEILDNFKIPQEVRSIGERAFAKCLSLDSIRIPSRLIDISEQAFNECSSLKTVIFNENLLTIGKEAFALTAIESLALPNSLKDIAPSAFYGCANLSELRIPSSVKHIGEGSFVGCNNLNSVYTYTIEPTSITETTFSTFKTATLYVPTTSFWNYYWDIGWSKFNSKNFKEFNEPYEYFYLNGDYTLDSSTGIIEGTPNADLYAGSALVVGDWESIYTKKRSNKVRSSELMLQTLGTVTMDYDGASNSASIIGNESLHIDSLYIKINVKGGKWYFFGFPFDVPLSKISVQGGSEYSFRHYDGAARAKNGQGGWKNVNSSYLKAAQGYIFQSSADDVLVISKADLQFDSMNRSCALNTYGSENVNDASWNMISNPYLSYYDMANLDYSAPITIWDGENYVAVRPGDDDYQFVPFEAFFVQKPEGQEHVVFNANQQLTKSQALAEQEMRAAAPRMHAVNPDRMLVNLVLSNGVREDRTRVVFNGYSSRKYETACDAAKFEGKGVPQIYTIDDDGVRYAINERPMGNGFVAIGYVATHGGTYTIDVARMDAHVVLYDAETNTIHDFEDGAYTFHSDQGEYTNRFSLGIREDATTGIDDAQMNEVINIVAGGVEFKANVVASIYNAAGVKVAVQHGAGFVELPAGIYIVSIDGNNKKIVVN